MGDEMNGKHGDDPALDIVHYGLSVYSPEVDALVLELAKLMEFRRLSDLLSSLGGFSVEELRVKLNETVNTLRIDAKNRGWEVE
jgi:hypothetical protein